MWTNGYGEGGDGQAASGGSRIARRPRVLSNEVLGEVVLLDLDTGTYYGANELGARIWRELEEGCTAAELVGRLAPGLDAEPELVARDVARFVASLRDAGLVVVSDDVARGEGAR